MEEKEKKKLMIVCLSQIIYTTYYILHSMIKNIEGKKIKCKCGYEWFTKSEMIYVCCPKCMNKNKVPKE